MAIGALLLTGLNQGILKPESAQVLNSEPPQILNSEPIQEEAPRLSF